MKPGGVEERRTCNDLWSQLFSFVLHPDEGKIPNAFCLLSVICIKVITKTNCNFSIDQSALLTASRQILDHYYGIFCCWVARVPPCETSPCSGKEQGKMAVFTGYSEQNSSQMSGVCLGGDGKITLCRQSIGWSCQPIQGAKKVIFTACHSGKLKLQPLAKKLRRSKKTTFLASNRSWSQVCEI